MLSLSASVDKEGLVDAKSILFVVLIKFSDVNDARCDINGGVFVVVSVVVDPVVGSRTLRATTRRTC